MSQTITLKDEDHTLGHLIQQQLLQDPDVIFAGYNVPSHSEKSLIIKWTVRDHVDSQEIFIKNIKIIKEKLSVIRQTSLGLQH